MKIDDLETHSNFPVDQMDDDYPSAATSEQVQGLLDIVTQNSEPSEDMPDLSDVELRLEEANCYKALLRNPLFDLTAGPIARRVERKIRDYIRTELKILLGLEIPKPVLKENEFTSDEINILKMLANKVLNKPVVTEKEKAKEPKVNVTHVEPLQMPATPQRGPATAKPASASPLPKKGGRPPKAKNVVKQTVHLPDGTVKEVEIEVKAQPTPDPAKRTPTLTAEQSAMHQTQVAMVHRPKGSLGTLVELVTKNPSGE